MPRLADLSHRLGVPLEWSDGEIVADAIFKNRLEATNFGRLVVNEMGAVVVVLKYWHGTMTTEMRFKGGCNVVRAGVGRVVTAAEFDINPN